MSLRHRLFLRLHRWMQERLYVLLVRILPLAKTFGAFIPNIIIQFIMFVMQIERRISSLLEYFIEMHLICLLK